MLILCLFKFMNMNNLQSGLLFSLTGITAVASLSSCASQKKTEEQKPYNIVYIMTDDHTAQMMSCYDKRYMETPNLDRIANDGVRFTNSFVANSLSGPSRACMITGKHSCANKFYDNTTCIFDGSQQTFPKLLQQAGYQTALIGKWHLESLPTGFNYWEIVPGQGDYYNPDFITQDNDTIQKHGYITNIITDDAIDWMENKRDKDKPFCILIHHKAIHRNWLADTCNLSLYEDKTFPLPDNFFDDYEGRPAAAAQEMSIVKDMDMIYDLKMLRPDKQTRLKALYENYIGRMDEGQRAAWDNFYGPIIDDFYKKNPQGKELADWKFQRYMRDYMRREIVMGGCYLGMAGHDVFNNRVREIVNTNEHRVVLLALDISNFKYINDFYGMDEGDKVMQDIADFYFINEPLCLASHGIGFDQFRGAYKADNMTDEDVVEYIARKNRIFEKELSERYPLVYQHVYVGLYFYDDPSLDVRMAVDRANLAKKSTKGRFDIPCCVYSADNCNEYLEHMDMSNEFVRACEEERIEIFLQPKISVSHNCVAGAEALVRMKTRAGELVSPARFVPVLEHTGMIGKLDDIMLDKTFAFQRQCIDKGIKPVPVSVNISRQRFTSEDLLKYMLRLQDKYQIDSSLVELEILETIFIDALDAMIDVINALRAKGFKINVDDFGSGYSSLNQIANIPADIIKFDRVFANRSLKSNKGRQVIKSLIEMLKMVEYELVFEGVETKEELDTVVSYGCDVIQGFYFDRPLPANEFVNKYYTGSREITNGT